MANTKKHWFKLGEAGSLLGMKALLMVYQLFGRRVFRLLLYPVMGYFYLRMPVARKASQAYLGRIQSLLAQEQANQLTPFRHMLLFGEVLLDKLLAWQGRIRHQDLVINQPQLLTDLDQSNRGGVIIVSHLGNIEVCSVMAQKLPNLRLTLLVYFHHAKKFNALLSSVSKSAQVDIIQVDNIDPSTAMLMADRVAAGELIVIAGDRTPVNGGQRTSEVEFLGAKAAMPQGAFILASLLKCPVYLMFCLKQEVGYKMYLEEFSQRLIFERRYRSEQIDLTVQRYADRLQYYCTLAPLQWFNFFPFWVKDQLDAAVDVTMPPERLTPVKR